MEPDAILLQELRDPQLPRVVRGYDEEATRGLLDRAAAALDQVARERDRLRESGEDAQREDADAPDAEAIGRTLATAAALGEQMVAEAKEQVDALRAEAQTEAEAVLTAAREATDEVERQLATARTRFESEIERRRAAFEAEREALLAEARGEVEQELNHAHAEVRRLRAEAGELSSFLEAKKNAFMEIAQGALSRIDELQADGGASIEKAESLLADLHPVVSDQTPTVELPETGPASDRL
jgi:cell division septum initiation protein DivIVA